MYKLFSKFFLWYSARLGYEVSITKENENSYELYSNVKMNSFQPVEKLEIPTEEIKRDKFRTNSKISYLDLKKVEKAGGIATLISKKVNELVNAVNLINFNNQKNPE